MKICPKCLGPIAQDAGACPVCEPPAPVPPPPPPVDPRPPKPEAQRFQFAPIDPSDLRPHEGEGGVQGLARSALEDPIAAMLLAVAIFAVVVTNQRIVPAKERGDVQSGSRADAANRGLLIRPAAIVPDVVMLDNRPVPFREAWVAEVGGQKNASWIGTEWVVVGTGRYRLCFTVDLAQLPAGARVEAMDGRPVTSEPRTSDGSHVLLHHVDVSSLNPGAVEFRLTRPGLAPNLAARFLVH